VPKYCTVAVVLLAVGIECASAGEFTKCSRSDGSVEYRVGKCSVESTELGTATTLDTTEVSSTRSPGSPPSDLYVEGLRPDVRTFQEKELLAQQCRMAPSLRYPRYRDACPKQLYFESGIRQARREVDRPGPGDWNYIPQSSSVDNRSGRRDQVSESRRPPSLPPRIQVINPYNGKMIPNAIPTDPYGAIDPVTGKRMQLTTPIKPQ